MTVTPRLAQLRFLLTQTYQRSARDAGRKRTPGLHVLLPVPLPERLILLAKLDGASQQQIKAAIKGATNEDVALTSERMQAAIRAMRGSLKAPYARWPIRYTDASLTPEWDLTTRADEQFWGGRYWNERWGPEVEETLTHLLFADVAVCLFGEAVPKETAALSLQQRLVLYLAIVESADWVRIEALLGCSEHFIRTTLSGSLTRLQGGA